MKGRQYRMNQSDSPQLACTCIRESLDNIEKCIAIIPNSIEDCLHQAQLNSPNSELLQREWLQAADHIKDLCSSFLPDCNSLREVLSCVEAALEAMNAQILYASPLRY